MRWFLVLKYLRYRSHIILICLGIALRLRHYLGNRSLWLDEACLSLGLSTQSFQRYFAF